MRLLEIPKDKYDAYRLDVIFNGYKWDPQFLGDNTVARSVLVLSEREHAELERLTGLLAAETESAELLLNGAAKLSRNLLLPRQTRRALRRAKDYRKEEHIRLMRFDFHPLSAGGWAVSEVNSDVPGGFAEASLMPEIAAACFPGAGFRHINFGDILADAVCEKVRPGGRVAFVHCTSYSDDRQAVQFLGDKLESRGFRAVYAAADHLRFENKKAVCVLGGNEGEVDAVFRFTPVEWLIGLKPKHWPGYFDTVTPSCNHPVAVYAQTKRFPLAFDALQRRGAPLSAWRGLLPQTMEVRYAKNRDGFIYKPASGRVGEGVSIEEACRDGEYERIIKDVRRRPRRYVAQRRFDGAPLLSAGGESFHVCLGCYSVEGAAAGYYARISRAPRIDSRAADIPVLIER